MRKLKAGKEKELTEEELEVLISFVYNTIRNYLEVHAQDLENKKLYHDAAIFYIFDTLAKVKGTALGVPIDPSEISFFNSRLLHVKKLYERASERGQAKVIAHIVNNINRIYPILAAIKREYSLRR